MSDAEKFAAIVAKSAGRDAAWAARLAERLQEAKPAESPEAGKVDVAALAPKTGPCGACP